MYDERKLHVRPWRGGQRRQVYGRWPTMVGWLSILSLVFGPAIFLWEGARFLGEMAGILVIVTCTRATSDMAFLVWSWVGGILLVAVLGLRLYGSLCLLRRKARARVWLLIYAGGMLAIQGFAATCILICGPIHSHAFCIETGWLLIPSMVFATWPTILLLLLKWPGVQAQMAAWPGGPNYGKRPRPEGQAAHTTAPAPCPPEARPPEWWKQWDA